MVDVPAVKRAIERKTGLSRRQIDRLVSVKASTDLLTSELAVLAVANDRGVSIQRFATADELAHLRGITNGAPAVALAPPASRSPSHAAYPKLKSRPTRGRTVFVVHGRNVPLKDALFDFLRSLDLQPLEWNAGIKATKIASPTVKQIIDALFAKAVAVVVLLTPDDLVVLKPQLRKERGEKKIETEPVGQARPNVLFEAGMALSSHQNSTVLVQIGDVKPFTDVGGIHLVHMDNSVEKRQELATKLQNAGCIVNLDGTDWVKKGNFEQETYDG